MSRIAIIGAGAWGTGLAIVLGRKGGHEVRLWAHEPEVCESITQRRVITEAFDGDAKPLRTEVAGGQVRLCARCGYPVRVERRAVQGVVPQHAEPGDPELKNLLTAAVLRDLPLVQLRNHEPQRVEGKQHLARHGRRHGVIDELARCR